jgi:secreted trypsin-like serine protease
MKKIYLLIISLFALKANSQTQVVGGSNADNNYPYFTNLTLPGSVGIMPLCGASLIDQNHVLTAAHCLLDFNNNPVSSIDVVINAYSLPFPNSSMQRFTSSQIFIHPYYNGNDLSTAGDIAIIKMPQPSNLTPIQLPTQGSGLDVSGTQVRALGFGIHDTANLQAQIDTLQLANIFIIDRDTCNSPNRYDGAIKDYHICAGRLTSSAIGNAAGDSGGPLVYVDGNGNHIQLGIVSWGQDFYSNNRYPGVYTRVEDYLTWIQNIISGSVSQNENYENELHVFANNRYLNFRNVTQLETARIFSATGSLVQEINLNQVSGNFQIPFNFSVTSGIYFISVVGKNIQNTFKIVLNN